MSVHDETWDRCRWCGKVNKDWHGDYHTSKGCLKYDNHYDWLEYMMGKAKENSFKEIKKSAVFISKVTFKK